MMLDKKRGLLWLLVVVLSVAMFFGCKNPDETAGAPAPPNLPPGSGGGDIIGEPSSSGQNFVYGLSESLNLQAIYSIDYSSDGWAVILDQNYNVVLVDPYGRKVGTISTNDRYAISHNFRSVRWDTKDPRFFYVLDYIQRNPCVPAGMYGDMDPYYSGGGGGGGGTTTNGEGGYEMHVYRFNRDVVIEDNMYVLDLIYMPGSKDYSYHNNFANGSPFPRDPGAGNDDPIYDPESGTLLGYNHAFIGFSDIPEAGLYVSSYKKGEDTYVFAPVDHYFFCTLDTSQGGGSLSAESAQLFSAIAEFEDRYVYVLGGGWVGGTINLNLVYQSFSDFWSVWDFTQEGYALGNLTSVFPAIGGEGDPPSPYTATGDRLVISMPFSTILGHGLGEFGTKASYLGFNPIEFDVHTNHVLAVDSGNHRVLEFDRQGNYLRQYGTGRSSGDEYWDLTSITDVSATPYFIMIALKDPPSGTAELSKPYRIAKKQPLPIVRGILKGRIMDAVTGVPIQGALVTLQDVEIDTFSEYTDYNGEFEMDGVPAKLNTVHVVKDGYWPADFTTRVLPGETREITIYMYPISYLGEGGSLPGGSGGVEGYVMRVDNNAPVVGATCSIVGIGEIGDEGGNSVLTEYDGFFVITGLPDGHYVLHIDPSTAINGADLVDAFVDFQVIGGHVYNTGIIKLATVPMSQ